MSVTSVVSIHPRLWRGYDDPGLPVGMYIAHNTGTGDGTGGTNELAFVFKAANEPASGRFFNIEQFNVFEATAQGADILGSLRALDFEALGQDAITTRRWRFAMTDDGTARRTIDFSTGPPPMPLFLGQTARAAAFFSHVVIAVPNVNTQPIEATIQGYIWEPRSILAEGGLRRPIDALYGG